MDDYSSDSYCLDRRKSFAFSFVSYANICHWTFFGNYLINNKLDLLKYVVIFMFVKWYILEMHSRKIGCDVCLWSNSHLWVLS